MPGRGGGWPRPCADAAAFPSIVPGGNASDRVDHPAVRAFERGNALHLVIAEHKAECIDILRDTLGVRRSRNSRDTVLLNEPAQRDLGGGLALGPGDFAQRRISD